MIEVRSVHLKWLSLSVKQQCYFNIGVGFWYLFTDIRESIVKVLIRVNAIHSAATSISRLLPDELKGNWRVHTWVERISDVKLLDAGQWLNATRELLPIRVWDARRYITIQLHNPKLLVG